MSNMGTEVNTEINRTTINELVISLFLRECKEGIVIHNKNKKPMIWDRFEWVIDNGYLEIINNDTKEKFEINGLGKWEVTDSDFWVVFKRNDENFWIEMM